MIDKIRIYVKAGDGGSGMISFIRTAYAPKGGPDGGNGGKGGDIYLVGNKNLNTLLSFKFRKNIIAKNGEKGGKQNSTGASAEDIFIEVPLGTSVLMENTKKEMDILDTNPILILHGGKGGIGNAHLATSSNQAPKFTKPAGKGEESFVYLQLKLIGDVGLVGLPNAGKSSFLNSCTNANSLVGDYAFTTLEPVLGVYESMIIVDIPGIIERASMGIGLGLQFLDHISRCKVLLYMIDATTDVLDAYKILQQELKAYGIQKDYIVVLNKIDLLNAKDLTAKIHILESIVNKPIFTISTINKEGVSSLLKTLLDKIH